MIVTASATQKMSGSKGITPRTVVAAANATGRSRDTADSTRLALGPSFGRPANWESICAFEGVHVLANSERVNRRPAVVEAAHGKGRIVITSLHIDALYDKGGALLAPASQEKAGKAFAAGLMRWTALVRAGRAPQVVPTKPWVPPPPLPFVEGSFTLAVLPDTQIYTERWIRVRVFP